MTVKKCGQRCGAQIGNPPCIAWACTFAYCALPEESGLTLRQAANNVQEWKFYQRNGRLVLAEWSPDDGVEGMMGALDRDSSSYKQVRPRRMTVFKSSTQSPIAQQLTKSQ